MSSSGPRRPASLLSLNRFRHSSSSIPAKGGSWAAGLGRWFNNHDDTHFGGATMRTTISMLSVVALVLSGVFTTDFGSAWAQTSCDFMTGGGFIVFSNGTHGNFGVGGGCKKGSPTWGHLEYVDHGSGLDPTAPTPFNVHGTGVTGYFFVGPTTRDVSGTARTNDQSHPNVNYCVE